MKTHHQGETSRQLGCARRLPHVGPMAGSSLDSGDLAKSLRAAFLVPALRIPPPLEPTDQNSRLFLNAR